MTTTKTDRLFYLQHLLLAYPEGLTQAELASELDVHRSTIMRYVNELSIILPIWESEDGKLGIERDDYLASLGLESRRKRIATGLDNLLSREESDLLEFKVAACWNDYQQAKDTKMVDNIIKTVSGFMNSKLGGVLLIGVSDDGTIVGLANDYKVADVKKQNRDGYELFLRNSLNDRLGGDSISFYDIHFHRFRGKEICQIEVKPASRPIFLQGMFYIRNGNQTRQLTTQEAIEYIQDRWG